MQRFVCCLTILLFAMPMTLAANKDFHIKFNSRIIETAFSQALMSFVDDDFYLNHKLDNIEKNIDYDLDDINIEEDMVDFAKAFAGVNLEGKSTVKIKLINPKVRGKIRLIQPKFTSKNPETGNLIVETGLEITNYNLTVERILFIAKNLADLRERGSDSCQSLIMDENKVEGEDYLLMSQRNNEEIKQDLEKFYKRMNSNRYKHLKGSLWTKIRNFQIGWSKKREFFGDNRNRLIVKVKAEVNLKKGGKTLKVLELSHNLNKKGGAWIPLYLPSGNITLPPIFLRTMSNEIYTEDGVDYISRRKIPRCTEVNTNPIKELANSLTPYIARQLSAQITKSSVNKVVNVINQNLASLSIPALPRSLVLEQKDSRAILSSESFYGQTYYVYKDIQFDFLKDIQRLIGSFTTYRSALGFQGIYPVDNGEALEMGIDSKLIIDGTKIEYRETVNQRANFTWHGGGSQFEFSDHLFFDDVGFALSGKMLNKIANLVKDHYLKTKTPSYLDVYLEDNLYQIDNDGWIVLAPRIKVTLKGYEAFKVTFKARVKPYVETTQDGRSWLKIKMDIPSAKSILNKVQAGTIVKVAETAFDILLWPLYPVKEYVVKPKIKKHISSQVQKYINNVTNNYKKIELTNFVKTYGIRPSLLKFHSNDYAEFQFQVKEFYKLDEVVAKYKDKMGLNNENI